MIAKIQAIRKHRRKRREARSAFKLTRHLDAELLRDIGAQHIEDRTYRI